MQNISLFYLFILEIHSISVSHDQIGLVQVMSTQKCLDQLLIYVNLYQHAKNQPILLICSRDMVE